MRAVSRRGVTAWGVTSGYSQVNCSIESHVNCPRSAATSTRTATRTIDLGFHCNISRYLREDRQYREILSCRAYAAYPSIGGFAGSTTYEEETRPASARGRRPHAKRFSYQPDSVATATP